MEKLLKIILYFLKGIIYLIPVLLLGWLLFKDIVWSGEISAIYDFKSPSPFISVLRPQSRISEPQIDEQGVYFQTVKEEPVYFDVRLPRHFDTAELTLKFKNSDQPIVQLGAMTDPERWLFDLKPLDNKVVNGLFGDKLHWSWLQESETVLFQKNLKFKSIKEFLANLPPSEKIAIFNYKLERDYKIPGYLPATKELVIDKSLRGSHRFYTYIKGEPLNLEITYQDVNRHVGETYLDIKIYQGEKEVYASFIADDGNISGDRKMSESKILKINLPNLAEGVYRVELIGSDDIFIRQLKTSQKYLTFIKQVYLADNVGFATSDLAAREEPARLYSNGHKITAYTSHVEGLQNLGIFQKNQPDQILSIFGTHQEFSVLLPFDQKEILVPKNDILIKTNGSISFSRESFFVPEIANLSDGEDFDRDKIDYVIADYLPPETSKGWNIKKINFKLDKYSIADEKLHFIISLPNLEAVQKGIAISEIGVRLKKEPLNWQKFFDKARIFLNPPFRYSL